MTDKIAPNSKSWAAVDSGDTGEVLFKAYSLLTFAMATNKLGADFTAYAQRWVLGYDTWVKTRPDRAEVRQLQAKNATAELELAELDRENASLSGRVQHFEEQLAASTLEGQP